MDYRISKELVEFLENSPSSFHAAENMKALLLAEDFEQLHENQKWQIRPAADIMSPATGLLSM